MFVVQIHFLFPLLLSLESIKFLNPSVFIIILKILFIYKHMVGLLPFVVGFLSI